MYYIVRGHREGKLIGYEGDIDAEHFPDRDLDNGPSSSITSCRHETRK